jgi:hypothetical protein
VMRKKRRIWYAGALGLLLPVMVPGTAVASGTQNVQAAFSPQKSASISFPASTVNLPGGLSKNGTIRQRLFLTNIVGEPPALQTVDIHAPEELKFTTKGIGKCDPASIEGLTPDAAREECPKAQLGTGSTRVLDVAEPGLVTLFNGTKQNGNPTVLFHTFTVNLPIVLVSELQDSPLGPPYGKMFHTPVSTTVGGGVPLGIVITDTDFTLSKTFKDKKIAKKAEKAKKKGNTKKAKKLKKKAKKSWVRANCTDGTLQTRVDFIHATPEPTQSPTIQQQCTS